MLTVSHSWKASVPMKGRATCPVMATMGVESIFAGGQASHQVCRARSGRCDADSDTSRQTRVGLGRVGRRLLVPHQYVPQLRVVPERVVEGQDAPPGWPKITATPSLRRDSQTALAPIVRMMSCPIVVGV